MDVRHPASRAPHGQREAGRRDVHRRVRQRGCAAVRPFHGRMGNASRRRRALTTNQEKTSDQSDLLQAARGGRRGRAAAALRVRRWRQWGRLLLRECRRGREHRRQQQQRRSFEQRQRQRQHYRDRYKILRNILFIVANTQPLYRNYMNKMRLAYAEGLTHPKWSNI